MAAEATPLSDVRFLTVAEVAAIMRVSKMTVYRLVHSGDLEAIRVGRSFRVPEQAVTSTSGMPSSARLSLPRRRRPQLTRRQCRGAAVAGHAGEPGSQRYAVALACCPAARQWRACAWACPSARVAIEGGFVGSVIKKRRKRMAKKKHRKLLRKTRVQRRNKK